jgi:predicted DsbA family dithiol-disulfide isomerase
MCSIAERMADFIIEPSALRAARTSAAVEVVEYTDPFCPWAWGTEPKLRRLRLALGGDLGWRRVLGILVDGGAGAVEDPGAEAEAQYGRWMDVAAHTAAPMPTRLEWPVSSSWPASRAVKAAEQQGSGVADVVMRRLRESLFLFGRPGDSNATVADALDGADGLDLRALLDEIDSDTTVAAVAADWEETRSPLQAVVGLTQPLPHPGGAAPDGERLRYRFPTLVISGAAGTAVVPGWRSYQSYVDAIRHVAPTASVADGRVPTGDDALELFETLTEADIGTLTVTHEVPTRAVVLEARAAGVWTRPGREARLAATRTAGAPPADAPGSDLVRAR